jgi:hypothetical protein
MTGRLNEEAREYFRKQGARGGKLGVKGRMEKLTPEKRSEIARNAVMVRELKRRQNDAALTEHGTAKRPRVTKPKGKSDA